MTRYFISIFPVILVFLLSTMGKCQIPTGDWRDHLPYSHGKKLAEYDNRIFCSTQDGSLFSYSMKDRSIKKHSKVSGLSDAEISTIGTSEITNTFLIGYSNGNIDLIRNDSIINIPDIKRKLIMGGKSINNVYFRDQYAYLACGFGIVLCDLNHQEIKDTYFFGPGGTQISVNNITSDGTNIYAATQQGIFKANLNDPNLLDFNAWNQITSLPDPDIAYNYIISYNNRLITLYRDPVSGFDNIIAFDEQGWEIWENSFEDHFEYLGEQKGYLKLSTDDKAKIYNPQGNLEREVVTFYARDLLLDSKNNLWYSALFGGLASLDESGNGTAITPEGPAYRDAGDIEVQAGNVWVGGGTFNSQWSGYGAYSFIDERWAEYNANRFPAMKDFLNISEISIDPFDAGHVIGGSYGFGIAEFQNGELMSLEDEKGGILLPVTGYENQPGYLRITGIDFDQEGNLFAATSNNETGVYRKARGDTWKAVELEYDDFEFNVNVGEILANREGQIWVALITKGILVFTEENGISTQEKFLTVKNQEGHLFDEINCLAEDKEGSIWVGTNKGPVIYFNPVEIFETGITVGYQPVIPRNDGTSFASLLLSSERINDIEVDGADRKWIATEKSGVFLVSPDGKKEIFHFTEENSPLFSNSVQTVAVNDKTGEVFFGTDKGIIAFRGAATEGGEDFADVYVFPNPVRETFHGDITITGLVSNVNVKITDIAGNLVYETTALGGQALWNGRNFRGERVQTGVYMVFFTNEDGSKTHVTKLLFIH